MAVVEMLMYDWKGLVVYKKEAVTLDVCSSSSPRTDALVCYLIEAEAGANRVASYPL